MSMLYSVATRLEPALHLCLITSLQSVLIFTAYYMSIQVQIHGAESLPQVLCYTVQFPQ